MAYEQKEGQGSLFRNDRKEKDTHPDWTGEIKINGKLFYLSAWDKTGPRGGFFSLAIGKEKVPRQPGQEQRQPQPQNRPQQRPQSRGGYGDDRGY